MASLPLHAVAELTGITSQTVRQLARRGVLYTEDLLSYDRAHLLRLAKEVKGLTATRVWAAYLPRAQLLRVPGMDGPMAAALVRGGVHSYRELVALDAARVEAMLRERNRSLSGPVPDVQSIMRMQLGAARLIGTGAVHLTVTRKSTGRPFRSAVVRLPGLDPSVRATVRFVANENGIAYIDGLVPGEHALSVEARNHATAMLPIRVEMDHVMRIGVALRRGGPDLPVIDEFAGDVIGTPGQGTFLTTKKVRLGELPHLPPATVVEDKGDGIMVLVSLLRRRVGQEVQIFTFEAPRQMLPRKLGGGVLLPRRDGRYRQSSMSVAEYREREIARRVAEALGSHHA